MKIRGTTVATPIARRAVTNDTAVSKAPWSSKHTVETLCPAFTESGSVVACEPVEGYPLEVLSKIIPKQSGSGDPSPENVRPIESWTGAKLWRGGKNLLPNGWKDWSNYTNEYFILELPTGRYCASASTTVNENIYIYIMKSLDNGQTWSLYNVSNDGGNGYIRPYYGYNIVFDVNDDPNEKVAIWTRERDIPKIEWLQIEEGSVATEYEPYRGEEFTIDFGRAVYGGSYNWKTGSLTVTHKGAAMKDFYWQGVNDKYFISFLTDAAVPNGPGHSGLCSVFPVVTDWTGSSDIYNGRKSVLAVSSMNFSASAQVTVGNPLAQSVDEFTANLDENKAFLVYPLEIPITIQLTPQEILALSGTNTLYSDTGDTTVSGRADTSAVIEKLTNAIIALGGNV